MKILVTGGAGFIGGNLIHTLLDIGGEVMVIDNLSTGTIDNLDPRAQFRWMDILDDDFADVVCEFAPEVVVHLAAQPSVSRGEAEPELTRNINVEGTRRVIEAAQRCEAERIVFTSTAAVYGIPHELPICETASIAPLGVYGETKVAGEELLRSTLDDEAAGAGTDGVGVDYAILRLANVYGPRQDAHGEGGVVARFCAAIAADEAPTIFGDGAQTRDFVYVSDVVMALVCAIGGDIAFASYGAASDGSADGPSDDRGTFNISSGYATSVEQLLNALRAPANFTGTATYAAERTGDIRDSVLSPAKAHEVFEWEAGVDLTKGLVATWMWFSQLADNEDDGRPD